MDLPIVFDSLTNEWLPFLATRLWQMVLFHTTSTVSCKPEFQNLHMGAGVLLTTIQVIWNIRRNWWRSWILGYTNIKPENLFFDAKGHLKVCSAAVTSHPFVTAYWFPPHILVIMEHLRYIVSLGKRRCTCLLASVEVSHTSHLSSSWASVSQPTCSFCLQAREA
jgi:hypothetical protein